jgi:gas vesicle protein
MMRAGAPGIILTFIVGAAVGAVTALLFAPNSGEELRASIASSTNEGLDQVRGAGKQVKQSAHKLVDTAKAQVQDAIDAGEAAYNLAKNA